MKLIHALLPVCALLLPAGLRAEAVFEGKVTMTITGDAVAQSGMTSMVYSLKPGFMRIDVPGTKGFGGMIMDLNAKQMTILMPQQQMYMVRSLAQDPSAQAAAAAAASGAPASNVHPDFTNTGEKTTILGYTCTKLVVKTDKSTAEIWVTDQLGSFGGMSPGSSPFGGRGAPPPEWVNALKGVGFFPLRVVSTESNGKVFKLEVTAIDKGSQPDSLFVAPAGWRKFDLGAMMDGGGFPGARPPSGDSN